MKTGGESTDVPDGARGASALDFQVPTSDSFSMSDLSHLSPVHSNFVYWSRALFGMSTGTFVPSALLVMLARLADKALTEYGAARSEAIAHCRRRFNPDITHLMRAVNHMETLVGTLWRLLGAAEAVRRAEDAPEVPRHRLPTRAEFDRLNRIRRAMEHMDERIRDGRIQPGGSTMVMIGDYSIRLEGNEISHDELAWWIAAMSNLVLTLRGAEAAHPSKEWQGLLQAFAEQVRSTKRSSTLVE